MYSVTNCCHRNGITKGFNNKVKTIGIFNIQCNTQLEYDFRIIFKLLLELLSAVSKYLENSRNVGVYKLKLHEGWWGSMMGEKVYNLRHPRLFCK